MTSDDFIAAIENVLWVKNAEAVFLNPKDYTTHMTAFSRKRYEPNTHVQHLKAGWVGTLGRSRNPAFGASRSPSMSAERCPRVLCWAGSTLRLNGRPSLNERRARHYSRSPSGTSFTWGRPSSHPEVRRSRDVAHQ